MPVDEIASATLIVPTVVPRVARTTPAPLIIPPVDNGVAPPVQVERSAAAEEVPLPPAEEAALLINETLAGLNFVPVSTPGGIDALVSDETGDAEVEEIAGIEGEDLTPAEQAALLINETLEDLNFVPFASDDVLLVNETNPNLALFLEEQNLTAAQEAALAVNVALQAQTAIATAGTAAAALTESAASTQAAATTVVATPAVASTGGAATATTGGDLAAVVASEVAAPAAAATTVSEELNPAQPPAVPPNLETNPIAVPVYEVRNPHPAPPEPKPTRRDVLPSQPFGRVRPVDSLVLKQAWERRKGEGQREEMPSRPPLAERSIRQMVNKANEDLNANGLPLRLVLAKTDEGYRLDIYDCSGDAQCRLSQQVPLDLNELLTILDNLQHETGIIINIRT